MSVNVLQNLSAKAQENSVSVYLSVGFGSSDRRSRIIFLGSSMTSDTRVGAECTSFSLHPKKGENGICAIYMDEDHRNRDGKHLISMHKGAYFLEVTWKGGKPFINVEEPWFPDGRIGAVDQAGITVMAEDGTRYFWHSGHHRAIEAYKGYHIVSNPRVLLKYLYKQAEEDKLEAAAERYQETTEDAIEELKEQHASTLAEQQQRIDELRRKLADRDLEMLRAQISLSEMSDRFRDKANELGTWIRDIEWILRTRRVRLLFKSKSVPECPETRGLIDQSPYYRQSFERKKT